MIVIINRTVLILVLISHEITLFEKQRRVLKSGWKYGKELSCHIGAYALVKQIRSQTGFELMRQLAAYTRGRAAFKLFMFDGTLCIFGVAFRRFPSRFQMAGTIICNNHCTKTIFPRVGKMDFCLPRILIGRLCNG